MQAQRNFQNDLEGNGSNVNSQKLIKVSDQASKGQKKVQYGKFEDEISISKDDEI